MNHEKTLLVLFIRPWHSWNILTSVDGEQQFSCRLARSVGPPEEAVAGTFSPFSPRQCRTLRSGESHWKDFIGEQGNSAESCSTVTPGEPCLPQRWPISVLWAEWGPCRSVCLRMQADCW